MQVTGSGRGIGKAIALRLARDGYNIAVNDLAANSTGAAETVKEIQKLGREAISIEAGTSASLSTLSCGLTATLQTCQRRQTCTG